MIRKLIERFSRGIVLQRRLPSDLGGLRLLVSPDASLRYWKRDLRKVDPELLRGVSKLVNPADVVWDVGANVGLFTFASAGLAGGRGQVIAIEPDPWLSNLLRRSIDLNKGMACSVTVLPLAVTDKPGSVTFNIAMRGRAANFVSGCNPSTQTGGVRRELEVEAVTLDGLLARCAPPEVIKIDVEGAETLVLRGATRLLRDIRPKIICEVSDQNRAQVTELLCGAGYTLYDGAANWPECDSVKQCGWNTVALPSEWVGV